MLEYPNISILLNIRSIILIYYIFLPVSSFAIVVSQFGVSIL